MIITEVAIKLSPKKMKKKTSKQTKPICSKPKQVSNLNGCIDCPLFEICKKFKNK